MADPPATWQEHWFDHRQLLRLYHSDDHCAIYVDPDVRRTEVRWLPRFINVTWQYSKSTYGNAFGSDPRIYSVHTSGGCTGASTSKNSVNYYLTSVANWMPRGSPAPIPGDVFEGRAKPPVCYPQEATTGTVLLW